MSSEKFPLKNADKETSDKIFEKCPADWDMEKVFNASYKKYLESEKHIDNKEDDIVEEYIVEVIKPERHSAILMMRRIATAVACFVFTFFALKGLTSFNDEAPLPDEIYNPPVSVEQSTTKTTYITKSDTTTARTKSSTTIPDTTTTKSDITTVPTSATTSAGNAITLINTLPITTTTTTTKPTTTTITDTTTTTEPTTTTKHNTTTTTTTGRTTTAPPDLTTTTTTTGRTTTVPPDLTTTTTTTGRTTTAPPDLTTTTTMTTINTTTLTDFTTIDTITESDLSENIVVAGKDIVVAGKNSKIRFAIVDNEKGKITKNILRLITIVGDSNGYYEPEFDCFEKCDYYYADKKGTYFEILHGNYIKFELYLKEDVEFDLGYFLLKLVKNAEVIYNFEYVS